MINRHGFIAWTNVDTDLCRHVASLDHNELNELIYDFIFKCSNLYPLVFLTHWGREEMDTISQTTFSDACSWMKMHEFRLKFHWSLLLRFELTIFQHWFRRQAIINYLWWSNCWRIYASLGLNELISCQMLRWNCIINMTWKHQT